VTVPPAVLAFVPDRPAESVTGVPGGTVMVAPLAEPPESDVLSVVGAGPAVTVSTSLLAPPGEHGLTDPLFALSPL